VKRSALPAPRWQTPMPPGVVGSWGPDVAAYVADELGIRLDVWQRRSLNRALAFDATGRLVHRHYLTSAGRQNGKTVGVRGLLGWALTAPAMPPWEQLLGLAHDKRQARAPYAKVLDDLRPIRRRLARHGGLALTRYLGIRSDLYGRHREYDIASREAADTIRSMSVDLAVFDEVRTQRTYATWSALEPTTRARPDPLVYAISTAGDDRSVLLRDWWERGVRIIDGAEPADGFGMTWYAADDDDDPNRTAAIRKANPAVAEGRVRSRPSRRPSAALTPSGVPPRDAEPVELGRRRMAAGRAVGCGAGRPAGARRHAHRAGRRVGAHLAPRDRRGRDRDRRGAWSASPASSTRRAGAATVAPDDLTRLLSQLIRRMAAGS
jgi:hypothetical protein